MRIRLAKQNSKRKFNKNVNKNNFDKEKSPPLLMKGIFLTDLEHAIYLHNQRNELFIHTVIHIQIEFLEMDHK